MPPKQPQSKKAESKEKQKIVEDKTFGMKNKNKSKKVQSEISRIEHQVMHGNVRKDVLNEQAAANALRKKEEEKRKLEQAALLRPVLDKKAAVADGQAVCPFFKAGCCAKGTKCKLLHSAQAEKGMVKANIYEDLRDKEKEMMDEWSQEQLEKVVSTRGTKQKNTTDIICRHFLEAVEKHLYGYFWTCPNGGDACHYRHALPLGFVLKPKTIEKAADTISLEEYIEVERAKLPEKLTPITPESFAVWKAERMRRLEKVREEAERAKKEQTKKTMRLSGRELIMLDTSTLVDDEDADDIDYGELLAEQQRAADEENRTIYEAQSEKNKGLIRGGEVGSAEGEGLEGVDVDLFCEMEQLDV